MRYLLDTMVLIDHAAGDPVAIALMDRLFEEGHDLYTCDVVTCESLSRGEPADHVEPRRVVLFQPLEQRTGHVQCQRKEAGRGRAFDDRPVDVAHVIGDDVIEIPHGLVQMEAKNKTQRWLQELAGSSI